MTAVDITIHASFLPHDCRTVDQPGTSIVLHPPAADPGITDDERRTIVEMMAKGTYAIITLATADLDGALRAAAGQRRRRRPGADRAAVRGSRLRLPRSRGQPVRINEVR